MRQDRAHASRHPAATRRSSRLTVDFAAGPIFRKAFVHDPPTWLYHYTKLDAIRGILTQQALRATHIYHLNDLTEFHIFIEDVRRELDTCIRNSLDPTERAFLRHLVDSTRVVESDLWVFCASLSWKHDHLGNWNAYGDHAIGFYAKALKVICRFSHLQEFGGRKFFLYKVCYSSSTRRQVAAEITQYFYRVHIQRRLRTLGPKDYQEYLGELVKRFSQAIAQIAPMMKDPAYKDEREWRLVSEARSSSVKLSFKMRTRAGKTVPYVDYDLKRYFNFDWKNCHPIHRRLRILRGPNANTNTDEMVVEMWKASGFEAKNLSLLRSKIHPRF